jgi:hypothetical protein
MPKQNGTGPTGRGPMTGRGRGICIIPLNTAEEEFRFLKEQERVLREQLQHVETRLKVLEMPENRSE